MTVLLFVMTLPQGFRRESVTVGDAERVPMYATVLTPLEARTLRELLAQTVALLRQEPEPEQRDPAVERLFPDIYLEDADEAAQLRELTEESLRSGKESNALQVLDTIPKGGGEVCVTSEEAHAWMTALTDIRLILGARLEITDETDLVTELDEAVLANPNGPRVYAITVYHYMTFLQESLVTAVMAELDDDLATRLGEGEL